MTASLTHRLPLLGLLLLLAACGPSDYRPSAVGPEGEVAVVIDSTYWNSDVGEALQEELGQYVGTLPQPVRSFQLRPVRIEQMFEQIKRQKNVVFVAPLNDSTPTARFLRSRLQGDVDETLGADGGFVYPLDDVWRQHQQVVYVGATTPEALAATIRERGDDLRYAFNEATRQRITREIFERGRQQDLEAQLLAEHDFALHMQADWRIVPNDAARNMRNLVWLRRDLGETWRMMLVHYVENADPSLLSDRWIYATQDSLTRAYLQGEVAGFVEIDYARPLETEAVNFLGRYGFETRGLWDMRFYEPDGSLVQIGQGGPFLTYAFYDEPQQRIYLISSFLFAPRPTYDKLRFMRDLEAIMHTFRTAQEAEQPLAARD